ncbi:lung adenoma susceptibility protein 2 isoform X2 [Pseudochaenichthys georgianus]|uniref:lung adenoma susceptibility protein 2 isoform X2 n=1 Tax=Pseudochaenichthys georgianus TaxID=52239 RepID=UPI00146A9FE7|nr:lung adenoma susceptibility protein 2 isoform X2 [Pseudochaenichthys georgianus]
MESGHLLSPESTVTSLLSSSSHLRSSLLAPEHNTTFRHRDKNYTSASAALDAYISDFERSQSSQFVTRGLVLPHSLPSTPRGPRASTLRNTDVLREHLTDRELDFLSLPVSSLHHRGNRDRLSITTDELLSIPYDGSMPVTHTSAFLQGLLSQCGAPQPRAVHRSWDRLSSSHPAPQMKSHHPHPTRSSRCRGRPGAAMMNPDVDMVSPHRCAHRADPSVCLHLPRWFTSNKTDMDCSGISNVPDQKYPAWIQRCDVSERPPPSESDLWDEQDPRGGAPSWVAELDHEDQTFSQLVCVQVGSWQTLRDLRLQLAEHICLLAAENNRSGIVETMFRDNRLESLIQKADQVLSCLTNNPAVGGADGAVRSANTEQLLSSSHCCPPIRDSVTVGGVTEAGTDRGAQGPCSGLHGTSVFKQPGPVEALKQMLFRLQAVEAELQRQPQAPAAATPADRLHTEEAPLKQRSEGGADLETFPGGPSLQRAMHHLSRLKVLVEEPKEKPRGQKDEDEGRYSSSSADGLSCTQLKPS